MPVWNMLYAVDCSLKYYGATYQSLGAVTAPPFSRQLDIRKLACLVSLKSISIYFFETFWVLALLFAPQELINGSHRKVQRPTVKHRENTPTSQSDPNIYKYACPYCGMRFSRTYNLRGHLVKHTGIKEFACSLCGKEYVFKHCLKEHLKTAHHGLLMLWEEVVSD